MAARTIIMVPPPYGLKAQGLVQVHGSGVCVFNLNKKRFFKREKGAQ
jgi:hypothetical protein